MVNLETMLNRRGREPIMRAVGALPIPDCWVAAGFVRNAVWDELHGYRDTTPLNDIDVVYFDPSDVSSQAEQQACAALAAQFPDEHFSVKNQARMHLRNGDPPYRSAEDAMRRWPETCTAVGVAVDPAEGLRVVAPFGTGDLVSLVVRPTTVEPHMVQLARRRAAERGWLRRWPLLKLELG